VSFLPSDRFGSARPTSVEIRQKHRTENKAPPTCELNGGAPDRRSGGHGFDSRMRRWAVIPPGRSGRLGGSLPSGPGGVAENTEVYEASIVSSSLAPGTTSS
jgi:hypothetical protein